MERELFICSCENTEHQIVFSWFENDDVAKVYATIHLRKKSFWARLKYGIKYIFGYQCRYGAFDEFIFNPNDARRLQKVVNFLKRKENDIKPEERYKHYYNEGYNAGSVKGYEQAIDDAVKWLDQNAYLYCDDIDTLHESALIGDFVYAMKGE